MELDKNQNKNDLPEMETNLTLDVRGNTTGKHYTGTFRYRIPTLRMKCLIDRKRVELNGGVEEQFLEPSVALFHYMNAFLRGTLVDYPKWWKDCDFGYELHDSNVVETLFSMTEEFDRAWKAKVQGENSENETGPVDSNKNR